MTTELYILGNFKSQYFSQNERVAWDRVGLNVYLPESTEDQMRSRLKLRQSANPWFKSEDCLYVFECMMDAEFRGLLPRRNFLISSECFEEQRPVWKLLCDLGYACAGGEARRAIDSGIVSVNHKKVTDKYASIGLEDFNEDGELIVKVGNKPRYVLVLHKWGYRCDEQSVMAAVTE